MFPAFVFLFILVPSRDRAHRQSSSGYDCGFVFESSQRCAAQLPSRTLRVLRCPAWEAAASAQDAPSLPVSPLSQKISSCLLREELGRTSGELLTERLVSLGKGTPLGAFL